MFVKFFTNILIKVSRQSPLGCTFVIPRAEFLISARNHKEGAQEHYEEQQFLQFIIVNFI